MTLNTSLSIFIWAHRRFQYVDLLQNSSPFILSAPSCFGRLSNYTVCPWSSFGSLYKSLTTLRVPFSSQLFFCFPSSFYVRPVGSSGIRKNCVVRCFVFNLAQRWCQESQKISVSSISIQKSNTHTHTQNFSRFQTNERQKHPVTGVRTFRLFSRLLLRVVDAHTVAVLLLTKNIFCFFKSVLHFLLIEKENT